jgi:uncharacterized protein
MVVETQSNTRYSYDFQTNSIDIIDANPIEKSISIVYENLKEATNLPNINTFVLEITRDCNLRCNYCCYSGIYRHSRTHEKKALTFDRISGILNFIDETHKKDSTLKIAFYGGESLLEFDWIQSFVEQAKVKWNNNVGFSISTNGLLLRPNIVDFLVLNQIELFVSLDGFEEYHDAHRKTKQGKGSYELIYQNLLFIQITYPAYFSSKLNILVTLQDISDLKKIAIRWQEDSLLSKITPTQLSGLTPNHQEGVTLVDEEKKKAIFYDLLQYYINHLENIVLKKFFFEYTVDLVDRPIHKLPDRTSLNTCLPFNHKCYIDANGHIGICEKMCDTFRIGTLIDGFNYEKINQYITKMAEIRHIRCSRCEISRICETCLLVLDLNEEELDIHCKNQLIDTRINLLIFCELAELDLLT